MNDSLVEDVVRILRERGKIAAIKHYRKATGCGLKESKEAIEEVMARTGMEPAHRAGCTPMLLMLVMAGLYAFA